MPDHRDEGGADEGEDEQARGVEAVQGRIRDRGGERQERGLDGVERANARQQSHPSRRRIRPSRAASEGSTILLGGGSPAWARTTVRSSVSAFRKRTSTEIASPRAVQIPIESQPPSARIPSAAKRAASVV